MSKITNIPRRLKSLSSDDILPLKDANGDYLVVTKQEVAYNIRELLRNEMNFFIDEEIDNRKREYKAISDKKIKEIEKSIDAMISFKFDLLAEKICDALITRKFNEEVERRVNLLLEKKSKK